MSKRPLLVILFLAAALRFVVYMQVEDGPTLYLHHWTETDNAFYNGWAKKIVAGDLLSVNDVRPYHSWHTVIARRVLGSAGEEPLSHEAVRRVWDRWLGERTFYQDPLYPYLVAGVYALFGYHVRAVFLGQALLGLMSIAILYALTEEVFDRTTAIVAGFLAAFFGPQLLYELVILRTALTTFLGALSLWLAVRALGSSFSWARLVAAGAAAGAAFLATSSSLGFFGLLIPVAAWRFSESGRAAVTAVGALVVGFSLAASPIVLRNLLVGLPTLSLASSGAITFVNHNAADYSAMRGDMLSSSAAAIMAKTDGRFAPAVLETIRTHPSIGGWPRLVFAKLLSFWRADEIPNNDSYEYFLLYTRVLSRVGVSFAWMAPLAILGFALAPRRSFGVRLWILHIALGIGTIGVFYNLSRFRAPIAFEMIPFAAFALVQIIKAVEMRRWMGAGAALAAVGFAAVFVNWGVAARAGIRVEDYGVGNEIIEKRAAEALAREPARTLSLIERHLERTEPADLRFLDPAASIFRVSILSAYSSGSFLPLHELAGRLAAEQGRPERAGYHRQRAAILRLIARQAEERRRGQPPG